MPRSDAEYRQLSPGTLAEYRAFTKRLLWFLCREDVETVGAHELRAFLAHVARGHEEPGGRFGAGLSAPVSNRTLQSYFERARTFFRWLVAEGLIDASPVETLRPPIVRPQQVQPFSDEQLAALVAAAKGGRNPRRDVALVLFLLDTGCRASEVCSLTVAGVDLMGRSAQVLGKGKKVRRVYLGRAAGKALWTHLRERQTGDGEPVFPSREGRPFTRHGLKRLVSRLGERAGIHAVRCSPHTFRHTFAVSFLRAGGNVFTLKELLGHHALTMCNRYVALAQADLEQQHRQFSPADRLSAKRGPQGGHPARR